MEGAEPFEVIGGRDHVAAVANACLSRDEPSGRVRCAGGHTAIQEQEDVRPPAGFACRHQRSQPEALADTKDRDDALVRVGLAVVGVKVKADVASPSAVTRMLPVLATAAEEDAAERIRTRQDHAEQMRLKRHPALKVRLLVEPAPPTIRPEHGWDIVAVEQAKHHIKDRHVYGLVVHDLRQVGGRPLRSCCGCGCHRSLTPKVGPSGANASANRCGSTLKP